MKCEKCNEREASFFYTATINGKTTQKHLCSRCAAEEGFDKAFDFGHEDFFDDFFTEPFGLPVSFFPRRSFFGSMMPAMTMTLPRFFFAPAETEQAPATEESGSSIPKDAGEEIRKRRELSALKHQLKEAVRTEDFEKAIELRDKIREMEK